LYANIDAKTVRSLRPLGQASVARSSLEIITLTKQSAPFSPSRIPPTGGTGAPDMVTVARSELIEAVIAELEDYFFDARATGLKMTPSVAVPIALGVIQRVCRDPASKERP
jgi:hypothetical protein